MLSASSQGLGLMGGEHRFRAQAFKFIWSGAEAKTSGESGDCSQGLYAGDCGDHSEKKCGIVMKITAGNVGGNILEL